jgi:hypothetical protein
MYDSGLIIFKNILAIPMDFFRIIVRYTSAAKIDSSYFVVLEYSRYHRKHIGLGLDARTKRNNNAGWGQNCCLFYIYVALKA